LRNSEGMSVGAMGFGRQGNTGIFANVSINGCQFGNLTVPNIVQLDTTPGWLNTIHISGCPLLRVVPLILPAIGGEGLVPAVSTHQSIMRGGRLFRNADKDGHGGGTTAAIVPSEPTLDSVNQLVLQPSFGSIPGAIDKPAR
jgi:hypothetical protein